MNMCEDSILSVKNKEDYILLKKILDLFFEEVK